MKKLAVLGYHKIGPPSPGAWETWFYVPTATFERQMKQLRESGWTVIDVATLLRALSGEVELPELAVMITFDDGFISVLEHAVPILHSLQLPAAMFVPTQHVGSASNWDANTREPVEPICSWEQLRQLEAAGISIQSHAVSHRTFSELDTAQIDREVRDSKSAIERDLAKKVELLAYPYDDAGLHPESTDAALHRAGYKAAFHFVGGPIAWPAENAFHLTRIPVWPDSDLLNEMAAEVSPKTETG